MLILLADDHPLFREGVKPVLLKLDAAVEVVEAIDYPSALSVAEARRELDLALLDLNMPGSTGINGVSAFRARFPEIPLVVLSAADKPDEIRLLLAAGAMGYISKASAPEVILSALRLVLAGGVYAPPQLLSQFSVPVAPSHGHGAHGVLNGTVNGNGSRLSGLTERQLDVLRLMGQGMSNRQIAESINVTEGTVKIHVTAILRALAAGNRTEAVLVAQKSGLA